jgi:integrase
LTAVTVPEPDDNNRGAWTHDEILKALYALEPHSWQAWLSLIGLTTGVRLGELVAAQRNWWNPIGFIELRDHALAKADKEHAMPIIECLRGPFAAYVECCPQGFLFDAPRPKDPDVPISNLASKAMNRLFRRNGIARCFRIEEARHSPIPKDLWEIISGHSKKTVSDRYGGEKPNVLAEANEKICEFLTKDTAIKAAMLRLVC